MAIGFIGGGRMAESIISAMIDHEVAKPEDISVFDIVPARREYLAGEFSVKTPETAAETVAGAHTVVLAVLPHNVASVAHDVAGSIDSEALVLSIMAGVQLADLESKFTQNTKFARVMPNTLIGTGHGYSALKVGASVGDTDRAQISAILNSIGKTVELEEEMFAKFTAFCAGPAQVYMLANAAIDAGVRAGFSRPTARAMTLENIIGAGVRAQETGSHPFELMESMTAPGGVTIESVAAMHHEGFYSAAMESMDQSINLSEQLG